MKLLQCSRRRTLWVLLAILLVPCVLWGLLLAVVPTEWARARLVVELEAATGRKVSIRSIRLGPTGRLRIGEISFAEVDAPGDPWLRVAEARLDVHLFQMLGGCCQPTEIVVDGLDLRIHRRADGSFECANPLTPRSAKSPGGGASKPRRGQVNLTLDRASVTILDDPSDTSIELTDGTGNASWTGVVATIESFKGRLNGGSIELAARCDTTAPAPAFEVEFRAEGVALGGGMKSLDLLVPISTDVAGSVDGHVDLSLALRGQGESLTAMKAGLKGFGSIRLDPINLSGSKLLDSLDGLSQIPRAARVGSVESHFAIDAGRVATDDLTIRVARLPITLAGWTDFDGRIDYRVKSQAIHDRFTSRLPSDARAVIGDLRHELGDLASLRITGTIADPRVNTDALGKAPSRVDKARLREAARKLGEKYLR